MTRVFGAVDTVDAPHPSRVELHGQIGIGRQKGMVTGYSRALASQLGSGSELWLTLTPKQFAQNVVERNFKDFAQKFAEPDS